MEKRLSYCKSCTGFFIIDPDKACPKCGNKLISSAITEAEWNRSSEEQKKAFKASLTTLGSTTGETKKAASPSKEKGKDKKSGKSSWGSKLLYLFVIIWLGYAAFSFLQPHDGAYSDYASAGKKVKKQIVKHDTSVYVPYNSDHYNPFIGVTKDVNSILIEACRNNGNPKEGDHLAANLMVTEEKWTQIEQRDGTDNLNITLTVDYITTKEQENELKDKADSILAGLKLENDSEYEKVRKIYNYICSNVTYDYAHLDDDSNYLKGSAYAAAVNGTAVCAGVADLFYYLATAAGLDARITWNDIHAWNFVKVDGKYYYLDATWDLGVAESDYQYFLKGSRDFVSILETAEYTAHRPSIASFIGTGKICPLSKTDKEYEFSEYAYGT